MISYCRINIPESSIRKLYWDEHKTCQEIANIYNVGKDTIIAHMMFLGIPRRTISEVRKGSHVSDACKIKISAAELGKKLSNETKIKMSASSPTRKKIPDKAFLINLYCVLNKTITEISKELSVGKTTVNRWLIKLGIERRHRGNKKGFKQSQESKNKTSLSLKNFYENNNYMKKHLSNMHKGKKLSDDHKKKISFVVRESWKNPELAQKRFSAIIKKPNKQENRLLKLLNDQFHRDWRYVGDGSLIIDGKNPDFVNINGKKQLIELFGDYWHKGEDPQERIDLFSAWGYKTLIIWERELKNKELLISKINTFVS